MEQVVFSTVVHQGVADCHLNPVSCLHLWFSSSNGELLETETVPGVPRIGRADGASGAVKYWPEEGREGGRQRGREEEGVEAVGPLSLP